MNKIRLATIFASIMLALPTFFPELVKFGLPFRIGLFVIGISMVVIIIGVGRKDKSLSNR